MANIEIEKAHELGFCFGVKRAIKILEASKGQKQIKTLGPIVHNHLVVSKLAEKGIGVIDSIEQVQDGTIAIASHGVSPELLSQIQAQQLEVIDTTCPTVRSAQRAARRLSDAGFGVVIFGEPTHPEVKGLLGWAGSNSIATLDAEEIRPYLSHRLGILSQTTQSQTQFVEFTRRATTIALPNLQELHIVNTLCMETIKRQEAAIKLARKSDSMIVVGGCNSANTRHLADVCSALIETHLIETAAEIKEDWLSGKQNIGVTAGASTPNESIEEVIVKLKSFSGTM